jgi:hypothetical protein
MFRGCQPTGRTRIVPLDARGTKLIMAALLSVSALSACGPARNKQGVAAPRDVPDTSDASLNRNGGLISNLVSPLNVFANGPGFTEATQVAYESQIANCMKERGWQYYPVPGSLALADLATITGLGILRSTIGYTQADGMMPAPSATSSNIAEGPNATYIASLAPNQRADYLYDFGAGSGEGRSLSPDPWGCQPRAQESLTSGLPIII